MEKLIIENKEKPIKVLLLCEGTFPYVKGGVSTWIYQIIKGLPEINFGVVFIGSSLNDYNGIQYDIPENLVYMSSSFLFEENFTGKIDSSLDIKYYFTNNSKNENKKYQYIDNLHKKFKTKEYSGLDEQVKFLDFYLNNITKDFFLHSKKSWNFIESEYLEYAPDSAFVNYFWTIRNAHEAIWKVAEIASSIPSFDIIHSPSTGYAGFLAALLRFNRKMPFILTEHGIYMRERKIDILNSNIFAVKESMLNSQFNSEHLKKIWIEFFEFMGNFCYSAADTIISLYEEARNFQISLGADVAKTRIVPNGVDVNKLSSLMLSREKEIIPVIALIGRVVKIKDVKTFIKSIKLVVDRRPDIKGWIVGPQDEDPDYVRECKDLVSMLGIDKNCFLLGFKDIDEILPNIGLLTLTSISEGMPLVVLEGFAAGVPAVCTDVGSCRQLVYGGVEDEDLEIGKAGDIVPIANPLAIANSYMELLNDKKKWLSAQKAALNRVKKYYSIERVHENYRNIYKEACEKWQA